MFKVENKIDVDLHVIAMENWHRRDLVRSHRTLLDSAITEFAIVECLDSVSRN